MTPRLARTLVALALVGTVGLGAGCSLFEMRPGGNMRSDDMFTYVSTPYEPVTVTLIDTRDQQVIWSTDVPIGQKLTVRFYADKAEGSLLSPDIMRWQLYDADSHSTRLKNQIPAPPPTARRLDVTYREPILYPEGATPGAADG